MSDEKRKVRVSLGSAAALGLQHVRTDAPATTAYLLSGEVCARNCAFCPQAREAKGGRNRLSRVTWPEFDLDAVTGALSAPAVKRVCLQTVDHPQEKDRLKDEIRVLAGSAAPLCVAANVRTVEEVGELLALGVDKVGIAVDAATSEIFRKIKGGSFAQVTSLLEAAARAYPGHVSTHLIIGLGETEKEAVEFLAWCRDRGITAGLFALTPIPGTELAKAEPPRLVQYRRVQCISRNILNWRDVLYMSFHLK
jgi:biotin synthase